MERRYSVTCDKCDKNFKFTVSLPGDAIPTQNDAQQSLYPLTSSQAEVVKSDDGILDKCKKNKPFSHALTYPEPIA